MNIKKLRKPYFTLCTIVFLTLVVLIVLSNLPATKAQGDSYITLKLLDSEDRRWLGLSYTFSMAKEPKYTISRFLRNSKDYGTSYQVVSIMNKKLTLGEISFDVENYSEEDLTSEIINIINNQKETDKLPSPSDKTPFDIEGK